MSIQGSNLFRLPLSCKIENKLYSIPYILKIQIRIDFVCIYRGFQHLCYLVSSHTHT